MALREHELKNAYIGEYKQPSEETYTTNFTYPVTTLEITNKWIIEKIEATFSISSLWSNSLWFWMYNPSSSSSSWVYFQNDGRFYVEVPVWTRIQSFSPFTTTTYKITYTASSITINVWWTDNVVSLNSSQSAIISDFFNLWTIYIDTRIDGSSYITVSPVTINIKYKQN